MEFRENLMPRFLRSILQKMLFIAAFRFSLFLINTKRRID